MSIPTCLYQPLSVPLARPDVAGRVSPRRADVALSLLDFLLITSMPSVLSNTINVTALGHSAGFGASVEGVDLNNLDRAYST